MTPLPCDRTGADDGAAEAVPRLRHFYSQLAQSHGKSAIGLALPLWIVACASAPLAVHTRPDLLTVPPVAAYALPEGLDTYDPVPMAKGAPAPADGILVSEADATRDLLARSELDARRVEGRALRAVLTVERAWAKAAIDAERARADRAALAAERWRRWGPWAAVAALIAGVFAASR